MTLKADLRIGNQTAYCAEKLLDPFEFAVAQGFKAFEFFPDRGYSGKGGWHEEDLDRSTRNWIKKTAEDGDILLSVHAPLDFNPLHQANDPRVASTVQLAVDIGATLINLHLDVSEGIETFIEALQPTLKATRQAGLKLTLENTVYTGPTDFNLFFEQIRTMDGSAVSHCGMCFDLGHANLCSSTHNDYLRFLDELSDDVPLMHLHLHENFGDRDSHLPLFTGPSGSSTIGLMGLLNRLNRRRFQGGAILEQWPNPQSLLVTAKDRLIELGNHF